MIIRQATVEDIHILQTFEKKLRTYYKTIGETVQVKRRSLEQIEKRIKGYLIAEINGKPVGTIYYKESVGCLALSHFWVNQLHRKKGVGTALFNKALEIGKELGCTSAKLIVRDRNINAKNFYLKQGFLPGGTLMFLSLGDNEEVEEND